MYMYISKADIIRHETKFYVTHCAIFHTKQQAGARSASGTASQQADVIPLCVNWMLFEQTTNISKKTSSWFGGTYIYVGI